MLDILLLNRVAENMLGMDRVSKFTTQDPTIPILPNT